MTDVTDTQTIATGDVSKLPAIPDDTGELVPMTQAMLTAWLDGEAITEDDNNDELSYELAVRILGASSEADALKQDDVRKVDTLIGKSFVVRSVTWRKSTKRADGKGRYAVMQCVDADGVPFIASCGATKVVLQLRKAQLAGWMPWKVALNAAETSTGNTVYELVAAPEDF